MNKLFIRHSFTCPIRNLNNHKFDPKNTINVLNNNKNKIINKYYENNLSLTAQQLLNQVHKNESLEKLNSFKLLNEKLTNIKEIEDLVNTKIRVPRIVVETQKYEEEILNIFKNSATSVELPKTGKMIYEIFGQPDPKQPISNIPCPGCGSYLHCKDVGIPGYLPSEKFLQLMPKDLMATPCQRCFLLKEKNIALDVTINKHEYRHVLREIKKHSALLLVLVDVFDLPNSFYHLIHGLRHEKRPIYIVGNKVDLIPSDGEGYLKSIKKALVKLCTENGFSMKKDIMHISLISAKTGYGIEQLITKLLKDWRLKGHVYILGCANSGKSTLFNALIASDFCRSSAREILQKATTSIWPGTTLNLLKFPILNPKPAYMLERYNRLQRLNKINEEKLLESQKHSMAKNPSLIELIGVSVSTPTERALCEKHESNSPFVVPSYTLDGSDNQLRQYTGQDGVIKYLDAKPFRYDDSKFRYWCFDTPGLINEQQVINLLNQEELAKVLPSKPIIPRSFVIKPGQVLFLSGLSRIDYIKGDVSIFFTIFASDELPVQIIDLSAADNYWRNKLTMEELAVPIGNKERMLSLPSLIGTDIELDGIGWKESTADIVLSSLGWASVTAGLGRTVTLRAYIVGGKGCEVRQPSLLPFAINLKGKRIRGTPCYEITYKK